MHIRKYPWRRNCQSQAGRSYSPPTRHARLRAYTPQGCSHAVTHANCQSRYKQPTKERRLTHKKQQKNATGQLPTHRPRPPQGGRSMAAPKANDARFRSQALKTNIEIGLWGLRTSPRTPPTLARRATSRLKPTPRGVGCPQLVGAQFHLEATHREGKQRNGCTSFY